MSVAAKSLFSNIRAWVGQTVGIQSAVLFGSMARRYGESGPADNWSDFDLHVIARDPPALERVDWSSAFREHAVCLQIARPATGGMRKVTAVFASGQVDLVIVPVRRMSLATVAMRLGLHQRAKFLSVALNEMATCLHSGYYFLKGEKQWGAFYARVAELPGVRLGNEELRQMADAFLCDFLWVLQKIQRGENIAAQHALHVKLNDVNLRFWRELRFRRELPLPSFGLGRRIESLSPEPERNVVMVSARADSSELQAAAWKSFNGLEKLMNDLVPDWKVPPVMHSLLRQYAEDSSRLRTE